MGRTQSAGFPSAPAAVNAMDAPSGDSTGGPAVSPVRLSVVLSGGLMTVRMDCTDWAGRWRKPNIPTAHPGQSRPLDQLPNRDAHADARARPAMRRPQALTDRSRPTAVRA